jgi:hypothetical protein
MNINVSKIVFILFFLYADFLVSQQVQHDHYYNIKLLNKNNIAISFDNAGSTDEYGGTWLQLTTSTILFDMGPWIVGKINDKPHLAVVQYGTSTPRTSSFSPGPILNGLPAILSNPSDSLKYRVYKISKGDDSSNPDYENWPVNFGAPLDRSGKPLIKGDQTLWTVFNDLDSTITYRSFWDTSANYLEPMPIEVQQTTFAHSGNYADSIDIFSNVIFIEWNVINKGSLVIDSTYIGLWTDIDFSNSLENIPAVDSLNQLGYLWEKTNQWGESPAVGFTLLQGPSVASPGNTAIFKGNKLINYKNLPLSSFHPISDDNVYKGYTHAPAYTLEAAWNIARGFNTKGSIIIDSSKGLPTAFPYDGDPVTNTGWIYTDVTGGGAGFNLFTGPFTLAPGDTQWVMFALVPALGSNNFESIRILRNKCEKLRSLPYDSLAFGTSKIVTKTENAQNITPQNYVLYQNYPNPFNPVTTINYSIPQTNFVTLRIYDLLGREVAILVNERKPAGNYQMQFNAAKLASGVYFYRLTAGNFITTKKLIFIK